MYNYMVNYIDVAVMPLCTEHQILLTCKKSTEMLLKRGFTLKLQQLDNKTLQILRDYMEEQSVDYWLTVLGFYRWNNVEREM